MNGKTDRRKREILQAYVESRVCDETHFQQDPNSMCIATAHFAQWGVELVGLGFSRRQGPDKWDGAFGATLARRRAIANIAAQISRTRPRFVSKLIGCA
jgi:hypothetical protein